MEILKYIKLNNNIYKFTEGLNFIKGDKNSGKTTLFYLIELIYGKDADSFFDKIEQLEKKVLIEWKLNERIYSLDIEKKVIYSLKEKKKISLKEYQKRMLERKGYKTNVFGNNYKTIDCFSWETSPDTIIGHKTNYARFFNIYKSFNSTSFLFFKLILNDEEELEKIKKLEKYFSLVGKKKNLSKITSAQRDFKKNFSEEEIKEIENNELVFEKYIRLKKLNKKKLDLNIIEEIKKISKIEIDDIIKFHEEMVVSYNEVIEKEKRDLEKEIKILNYIDDRELKEVVNSFKGESNRKKLIKDINKELEVNKKNIEEFQLLLDKINQELTNEFSLRKKELKIDENYKFENSIYYSKSNSTENYIIDLRPKKVEGIKGKKSGNGYITINFFIFLIYMLNKTRFPIAQFEKKFFTEVDNLEIINILEYYNRHLKNKQVFVYSHKDKDFDNLKINTIEIKSLFDINY